MYFDSLNLAKGDEADAVKLVAKISDFGLSKTFYDNIRYKKQKRYYVPWKWMALEYLQTGDLTITSDVWSYGVVLWEIFSLGKEPYMNKDLEDMLAQLKDGYQLSCPEEALKVFSVIIALIFEWLAAKFFLINMMFIMFTRCLFYYRSQLGLLKIFMTN